MAAYSNYSIDMSGINLFFEYWAKKKSKCETKLKISTQLDRWNMCNKICSLVSPATDDLLISRDTAAFFKIQHSL